MYTLFPLSFYGRAYGISILESPSQTSPSLRVFMQIALETPH